MHNVAFKVNLENIKFLKYEIPKNEVKLPGISKEEKTLKEFLKQSLGPKKKPAAKSLRCGQCEEKSANVVCANMFMTMLPLILLLFRLFC